MKRPTIAVFIHQPKCSVQSANGIIRALGQYYNFKIFTRHELESDFFRDVDMIAVPGGIGEADSYDYLMRLHAQSIRNFVAGGGYYLGICMGAYWADTDYFGLLNGVRAQQYIRHATTCTKRPHAKEMPVTWQGIKTSMYFYDGCTYYGTGFDTIATYPNGAPMAIIQDRIGLIGCHPEAERHWYQDYTWMQRRWQGPKHEYLLDFVDNLMRR
jgi:GMP synthase-like glutamine amidotransferase